MCKKDIKTGFIAEEKKITFKIILRKEGSGEK